MWPPDHAEPMSGRRVRWRGTTAFLTQALNLGADIGIDMPGTSGI